MPYRGAINPPFDAAATLTSASPLGAAVRPRQTEGVKSICKSWLHI